MLKILIRTSTVLLLLSVLFFFSCSNKNNDGTQSAVLNVAVSPEFSTLLKPLADNFAKRFGVETSLKTVEADKLWTLTESCDFLIGVERDKAIKSVKDSGMQAVLWVSDDVVLAVRQGETFGVRKARDLQQPLINPVAMPAQREEVGRRAMELFDYWKVRNVLQPRIRIVPDSASAMKMLKSGRVRAAVLPAHLVASDPGVKQAFSFSPLAHQSIRKTALRTPRSRGKSAADEFEHLLATDGVAVLTHAGYKAADTDF